MTNISPIRRAAPLNNLRPISDPRITAEAMVCAIAAITTERPAGLCETRWRILRCIHAHEGGAPSRAALRLCAGLNDKALSEHVQGLRWKGLILFETLTLSPSAAAMMTSPGSAEQAEPETLPPPRPGRRPLAGEADDASPVPSASVILAAMTTEKVPAQFAELLAEGFTVKAAAGAMGLDYPYANALLQRMRRQLGAQAV